jgi:hypothetical protein
MIDLVMPWLEPNNYKKKEENHDKCSKIDVNKLIKEYIECREYASYDYCFDIFDEQNKCFIKK